MRKQEKSRELMKQAMALMPGGVNSPVRAFRAVGGDPPVIARAKGAWLHDVDGNRYVDYVGTWGPAILGHADDEVVEAVCAAAQDGTSFGAPTAREVRLARMVIDAVDSVEKVRFVSSGTEATMSALRLARAATGRDRIVKFDGCYHGHGDSLLVKAGSGVETLGLPDSPGVPKALAELTITLPFNDLAAVERSSSPSAARRSPASSSSRRWGTWASSSPRTASSRGCGSSATTTGCSSSSTR